MKHVLFSLTLVILAGAAPGASAAEKLQVEIQSPSSDLVITDGRDTLDVEGVASAIGGVRHLDMIFVMDTSQSLRSTDPQDFRSAGAIGLVRNLSPKSDIKIGVVSFASRGELVQPMTDNRELLIDKLRDLPRAGSTNLAAGILTALNELRANGRPGSSRVIMLFTDGKSNERKAYEAAVKAAGDGATVQSLLLGSSTQGGSILDSIAWATGGSFVQVTDPAKLPQAFLDLRTTGVDSVMLSVNGSAPFPARLAGGTFSGTVPLAVGDNRIVARATSLDGDTRETSLTVNVRDASCAALAVAAVKQERSVLSLDDRAVEIVVDASRSMWGQIGGEAKMSIAKDILDEVSYWFPEDLDLALRAYGSTSPSDSKDCSDSRLLVPFVDHNRESIRNAIAGLTPTGQTPIAFALSQAGADFKAAQNDRAVVLVTDGIESCGGDPARAARQLSEQGIMVHVIGFGLGNAADEDASSLRAIADASGGRYVTAGSADELKAALTETVATPYSVFKGDTEVASGSLGSANLIYLPEGDYRVEVYSSPVQIVDVSLAPTDRLAVTLEKRGNTVSFSEWRGTMEHRSCEDIAASIERKMAMDERRRIANRSN